MSLSDKILEEAKLIQDELVAHRRKLHQNPEVHLDMPETKKYVMDKLREMGYDPIECGKSGVVALAGEKDGGKCFLIRADMDALPFAEETDLPYKSTNENMHACGHDLHAAMLLGAAKLLKQNESSINGTVKLMFQPAEETLAGAKDMIENGLMEKPRVDAAMMIHVASGVPMPSGMLIVSKPGIGSSAADWFEIHIKGKGGHGANPYETVDPLNVATHIHIALQAIHSREIKSDGSVLTIGMMKGGETANVIPDTAMLMGTIRTFSPEMREFIKTRLVEISTQVAATFRANAEIVFTRGCPSSVSDEKMCGDALTFMRELVGVEGVLDASILGASGSAGSEDFSYITELVPATGLMLAAGNKNEGYTYPPHHPKVEFDESALSRGAAAYAYMAMRWLEEN